MATYYVDIEGGKMENDGLCQDAPVSDYERLDIKPGDTVLFKRGSFIRGRLNSREGEEGRPVTYGAYGTGENPTFCGSVNLSDESQWAEEAENIWVYSTREIDEAANFIFNKSDLCGTLRWSKKELRNQGDFWDDCQGIRRCSREKPAEHRIYLYSRINPALFYSDIECAMCGNSTLANNGHDIIFQNLRFINGGQHGIAGLGVCRNLKIRNCTFEYIGGAVWNVESRIRLGNAVECWNYAENVEVSGCFFNNIYDSAVTHQGGESCEPAKGLTICDNIFFRCGMAAYEQRDRLPKTARFCNNICIDAGRGFSGNGVTMPRPSEIWPEPMGHHIFLWRIRQADGDEKIEVRDNIFYYAPYGSAVHSMIAEEAENCIKLEANVYYTKKGGLICRWHGKNYRTCEHLAAWDRNSTIKETDSADKKEDLKELLKSCKYKGDMHYVRKVAGI